MKNIIAFLFILFSIGSINAQDISDKKKINDIVYIYKNRLNLSKKQTKEIKKILKEYNSRYIQYNDNRIAFNKALKEETLLIYTILSREQFKLYKILKKEIEPIKTYKK